MRFYLDRWDIAVPSGCVWTYIKDVFLYAWKRPKSSDHEFRVFWEAIKVQWGRSGHEGSYLMPNCLGYNPMAWVARVTHLLDYENSVFVHETKLVLPDQTIQTSYGDQFTMTPNGLSCSIVEVGGDSESTDYPWAFGWPLLATLLEESPVRTLVDISWLAAQEAEISTRVGFFFLTIEYSDPVYDDTQILLHDRGFTTVFSTTASTLPNSLSLIYESHDKDFSWNPDANRYGCLDVFQPVGTSEVLEDVGGSVIWGGSEIAL